MITSGHDVQKWKGNRMEKVDFQKKAVVALLGKIAKACGETGVNPNITVSTRHSVTCFQLRRRGGCIQVSVKQSGEMNYYLSDIRGKCSGRKIYYQFCPEDSHECIIEKFAADFGRLYKGLLIADGLSGFTGIYLSYDADTDMELKEYEDYIRTECLSH